MPLPSLPHLSVRFLPPVIKRPPYSIELTYFVSGPLRILSMNVPGPKVLSESSLDENMNLNTKYFWGCENLTLSPYFLF